jgi:hypothetical protein
MRSKSLIAQLPHGRNTLFAFASLPPVTVMSCRLGLPSFVPQTPKRLRPAEEEMPLTNFCNQLVVTSTLGTHQFPSAELAPSQPPLPPAPFGQPAWAGVGTCASTAAPDSRERHLRPRVASQFLALRTPAMTWSARSPRRAALRIDSEEPPTSSVVLRDVGRAALPLIPPVAPRSVASFH